MLSVEYILKKGIIFIIAICTIPLYGCGMSNDEWGVLLTAIGDTGNSMGSNYRYLVNNNAIIQSQNYASRERRYRMENTQNGLNTWNKTRGSLRWRTIRMQ